MKTKNEERLMNINFKAKKNHIILYDNKVIKIKPYLSELDICTAIQMCNEQFSSEGMDVDGFTTFGLVQSMFNLVVVQKCTNINMDGVETAKLIDSKLINRICKHIYNYQNVWSLILKSLDLKNTSDKIKQVNDEVINGLTLISDKIFEGLNIISDTIPKEKEMEQNLQSLSSIVCDINKEDPKLLIKLVGAYGTDILAENEREKIKEERIKNVDIKLANKTKELEKHKEE